MSGREAYKIWAPQTAIWSSWARPTPFIAQNLKNHQGVTLKIPPIFYLKEVRANTAVILDTPEKSAVEEGLALANLGWRPVPLYNGVSPQNGMGGLVENRDISAALLKGAEYLKQICLPDNAPPVFLLDSNRMHKGKATQHLFDNSWYVYKQDLPTAKFFFSHGINKIIVRSYAIQDDLSIILYKLQKSGIKIYFTDGYEEAKETSVKKSLKKIELFFS